MNKLSSDIWQHIYSYDDTYIPNYFNSCIRELRRQYIYFGHRRYFQSESRYSVSRQRDKITEGIEYRKKLNPYQDATNFRITFNSYSRRFIIKIDSLLFEENNVKQVEVINYNVHREKVYYPKSHEYPFQNLPHPNVFENMIKNKKFMNHYIHECEKINLDNRIKSYEFMIILNNSVYIICEYGQHNGAYIEIYDNRNINNQTKTKLFISEVYARIIHKKVLTWLRIFRNSKIEIRDIRHPYKNKKIKHAICTIISQ